MTRTALAQDHRQVVRNADEPLRTLVGRGVLAGLAGGAAMGVFLLAVGEPAIRDALAIEAAGAHGEAVEETFSRGVQVAGGVTGALIFGVLLGAVFGVVYAAMRSRTSPGDSPFQRALRLGAVAYVAVVLVPALKYPANPPAVGDQDTIGQRTASYVTLLGASILITVVAWRLWHSLKARGVGDDGRLLRVLGLWVLGIGLVSVAWPASPDSVSVPAQLIWRFRLASLGGAAALWATLAIVFGWRSRAV